MNPFAAVIEIVLSFYTSIVLLRFFLQYFRADFYNPISQLVVKATDPLVKPLRKIIPGFGGLDISSIILAWLVIIAKFLLVSLLSGGMGSINIIVLLFGSIFGVVYAALNLYMFLIFVRAILSWFAMSTGPSPVMLVFAQLTEPLLARIRRMLPPMEGFDLSPMLALLGLFFVKSSISYYIEPLVGGLLL
ncbi:YggT family protein [Aliikangiella marina]|uniref:YggT family protein n=1 Tax=Aliikangiella marina TaxID=1712262 RepID=A0A545TA21_9GAMM|nr:YggT family protein [Aliikangiella marina]TQV74060.1 YggT family protein [Aliikangiella marina]